MLVLVEGESDAGAVHALAGLLRLNLSDIGVTVRSAAGITNFPRILSEFVTTSPGGAFCGMYDVADERHVRHALARVGRLIGSEESIEPHGFFACEVDLEDELIRALGTSVVQAAVESQGELASLRRFQAMPEHRASGAHAQLHRFLGTRATRKTRSARLLAERLDPLGLPRPLEKLAARLQEAAAGAHGAK
jgi:hypothetical protein